MTAPILLDVYCCQGGASRGYADAGWAVYGVDLDPQPNYPYPFHQGDAIEALAALNRGEEISFVHPDGSAEVLGLADISAMHASPPCQSFLNLGAVNRALGRNYNYPNLIGATRDLLNKTGLPYVIENVEDAKEHLIDPVRICGTGLGRPIRRHRLFESNIEINGVACDHRRYTEPKYWTGWRPNGQKRLSTVVQVYGNAGGQHEWPEAMGIDWMDRHGFVEAIPPAYTEHVGRQMLTHLEQVAA
jgi:DNA (cytosine-5)-methyltransferase 1